MKDDDWDRPGNTVNCRCTPWIYEIGKEGPEAVILPSGEEFMVNPWDMEYWMARKGISCGN